MSLPNGPSKLYLLLIVALGLVGGYVIYGQFIKPGQTPIPPAAIDKKDNLNSFRSMKIDFTAVANTAKEDLIISGEAPVNPGVTGKKDLFAPIP